MWYLVVLNIHQIQCLTVPFHELFSCKLDKVIGVLIVKVASSGRLQIRVFRTDRTFRFRCMSYFMNPGVFRANIFKQKIF